MTPSVGDIVVICTEGEGSRVCRARITHVFKARKPRRTLRQNLDQEGRIVLERVGKAAGIAPDVLMSECRWAGGGGEDRKLKLANVVLARFCCYRALLELAGTSKSAVGRAFGRDHGSIFNGLKRLKAWSDTEPKTKLEIERLVKIGKGES